MREQKVIAMMHLWAVTWICQRDHSRGVLQMSGPDRPSSEQAAQAVARELNLEPQLATQTDDAAGSQAASLLDRLGYTLIVRKTA